MPDRATDSPAIYPWQITVDINEGTVIGITALYDRSTSSGAVEASIDNRYRKWALPLSSSTTVKLWRVEPERLAIQLAPTDNGMTQVIYLAFDAKHPMH
jgi:hypothetical protein